MIDGGSPRHISQARVAWIDTDAGGRILLMLDPVLPQPGAPESDLGLGAFLAHPKVQDLPAVLEVPGADGKGPNADEIRKLRELHARAVT